MTDVTMLSFMASPDFVASLNAQQSWGIRLLDVKNHVYGKSVADLALEEAGRAAEEIARRNMEVYCMSTDLFYDDLERGERHFQREHLGKLEHALDVARRLKPRIVRLLAAKTTRRRELGNSTDYIAEQHPWLIRMYREAIDRIHGEGFQVTIENEIDRCIWARPEEITSFFRLLERGDKAFFTYDIQNLWVMGTAPSLEVYRQLAPLIGFIHLKGGQAGEDGRLKWRANLEDAGWPLASIVGEAVKDGKSPVICLNPSHGESRSDYDYTDHVLRDLTYIRGLLAQLDQTYSGRP